ncbi:MAG: TRAP transporter substrate-binding protein DctP [Caldilineaceae bacterium]|nr:TRAP transporter substrate-binding protein DctP [Caldilineaceae bacterium]MCB9156301.1 TRAP transporter substrate-binding protein DctP [Caldilineaceae bacterium]
MNRREFLSNVAVKAAGGAIAGLAAGCSFSQTPAAEEMAEAAQSDQSLPELSWQCATSWPLGLDTIFGGAQVFAERVGVLSGGKFKIEPRAAGELVPGLEVLNAVQEGAVQCGHTASYYYIGKSPVTAFGTALPFGLTDRQQNAWLYEAGGLEMMQDVYANRFGVIQFPAGNTGVQMGGWFNKEITSLADLQGLKMRIPGLGGQVMAKLGVTVQVLPGGEIFQALQTGAIDAAEWVGPYDDEKLGFHKAASFYYYPGWWEPGPTLEVQINLNEWNNLPELYKEIVKSAAYEANITMMARYDAKNPTALAKLQSESDIQLLPFPDDVMAASEEASFALYDEFAASDADFKSILDEWTVFRSAIQSWHGYAETAMLNYGARNT